MYPKHIHGSEGEADNEEPAAEVLLSRTFYPNPIDNPDTVTKRLLG